MQSSLLLKAERKWSINHVLSMVCKIIITRLSLLPSVSLTFTCMLMLLCYSFFFIILCIVIPYLNHFHIIISKLNHFQTWLFLIFKLIISKLKLDYFLPWSFPTLTTSNLDHFQTWSLNSGGFRGVSDVSMDTPLSTDTQY